MPTGRQIRAARILTDWDADDLAKRVGMSRVSIQNIERGDARPKAETMDKIVRAFADAGIEFIDNEGVRFQPRDIQTYRGSEGFKKFMDDVYEYVKDQIEKGNDYEPICSSSVNDKDFIRHLGDHFTVHINRMNALKGFKHRILLKERPASLQPGEASKGGYREYRKRSPQDTANVPFYVYGDKLAILMLADEVPQIVIINSRLVAQGYREIFNALWEMAKPFD